MSMMRVCLCAGGLVRAASRGGGPALPRATGRGCPDGRRLPDVPGRQLLARRLSRCRSTPRSAAWLSHMSTDRGRCTPTSDRRTATVPDYGIPITVVGTGHPQVPVRFDYADESDRVRYPLGVRHPDRGRPRSGGDRHAIMVNTSTCRLYETWATRKSGSRWRAGSGATWALGGNPLRTDGWTSADAAGLPILPGLLRWDEVRAGARRPRHPVHHRRDRRRPTCGRPATTPGPARSRRTRRWGRGSGSRRRTTRRRWARRRRWW